METTARHAPLPTWHAGGEDLPAWIERDFDRRAVAPRLGVLLVLFLGALGDYGHEHRTGHWIVLVAYGVVTMLAAFGARSRSLVVGAWLPLAATVVDAAIAVYVIADHVPRFAGEARLATGAVSLLPAFLFLLQTGMRLRPGLIALFGGLVIAGWIASLAILSRPTILSSDAGTSFAFREGLSLVAFAAASGFVLYAATWIRSAAAATVRAGEERVLLSRFLPDGVATDVVRRGQTSAVTERHATLLDVDLRGSSALAREYPAPTVVDWLLEFRRLVHDVVTKHGGIVDKYVGDGVIALFLDGPEREQATRALATMDAIFNALERWNELREQSGDPGLRVIAVAHCGRVLAGVFDDGRRAEFTVLGPVMNDLSRIERRTKEEDKDVVVSADLLDRLDPEARKAVVAAALEPSEDAAMMPALFALKFSRGADLQVVAGCVRGAIGRLARARAVTGAP